MARHLGRRYIGIERDPAYAKAAEARIAAVQPWNQPRPSVIDVQLAP